MPEFESNPLEKLSLGPADADEVVDLRALALEKALARVTDLIASAPPGRRYLLQFSPACGNGEETLFQPLGKLLLRARREGHLAGCLPTRDGGAYLIVTGPR